MLVEDSADDVALLERELRRGFDPVVSEQVQTEAELRAALARAPWDLVITDFSLPTFGGPGALEVVKASGLDIPVIMMSGSIDEEAAIASLVAGARDFIAKGRLGRLLPAVVRELREAEMRRERARALEALRDSEERYRAFFESSPLPTVVFDVETRRFLEVNEAAVEHYGFTRDELLAGRLDDLWLPEDAADRAAELAATSGPVDIGEPRRQRKRDGSVIEVEIASHELQRGGRRVRMSVFSDVTARKALEAQLRQAQKIEAIGQLASGIAHDFNNVLSVILSFASLIADQLPEGSPLAEDVDEIAQAAQRGSLLTQQLLAFSRRQPPQIAVVDVNLTI
ncbi:MAG TPA: PAS domain S-box protein, partial [Labilithrix sp.]|nr:PAS domain S-box protein [Labilithrix sp.]